MAVMWKLREHYLCLSRGCNHCYGFPDDMRSAAEVARIILQVVNTAAAVHCTLWIIGFLKGVLRPQAMARFCQAIALQLQGNQIACAKSCSNMHEQATKIAGVGFSNMKNPFLNFSRPREAHRRESLTLLSIGNCKHCQAISRQLPIACGRILHFGNPMFSGCISPDPDTSG
jgi:hypothetical protein